MTKKYRPSNGTEGERFMAHFCDRCKRDASFRRGEGDSCKIIANTMAYSISDENYPSEWVEHDDGSIECTAFDQEPER